MSAVPSNVVAFDAKRLLVNGLLKAQPKVVRAALRGGVDLPQVADLSGQSPLLVAVRRGCNASVLALLSAGCEPNDRGAGGISALHIAAGHGAFLIVESLLAMGASVDPRDLDGFTPLYRAAREGHTAVVDRLLRAGADPNAQGAGGMTPLHIAACEGRTEIVRRLLDAGGYIGRRAYRQTGIGPLGEARYEDHDVLMCAEWSCCQETVDLVREHRRRLRASAREHGSPLARR